jgi:2-C-methyl-D-erythritol 4-phosphate cytidylyltransferase
MMSNNCAIVLAGGKGERFGQQKQFIDFAGKPLYKHVYDKAIKLLPKENVIVVGVDIEGGATRSFSIINGLKHFKNKQIDYNKVIILEGARPLVTEEQIETLLKDESKSTTFVMPLVNTVIKRDGTYMNREDLYDLLTPQAFDFNLLYEAYNQNKPWNYTDETRLMFEVYNIKPKFIEGGQNLIKLTYIKDLPILEQLFKLQQEGKI